MNNMGKAWSKGRKLLTICLACFGAIFCLAAISVASDNIVDIRIATWTAPTFPSNIVLTDVVNKLKIDLKGKANIHYFEAASLYTGDDWSRRGGR